MAERENEISPKEAKEALDAFDPEFQDTDAAGDFARIPANIDVGMEVIDQSWIRSTSGTTGLQLTMEIMEPEEAEGVHVAGSRIWHTFWITSKNLKFVKRDVAKFGVEINSLGDLSDIDFRHKTIGGQTKHEEYEGRTSTRLSYLKEWDPKVGEGESGGDSDASKEKAEAKTEPAPATSGEKDPF